jgi:integrase
VDTGYVFTTVDGRPLRAADVTSHFKDLVAERGLPPIRLHDLRHGHATHALAAGVQMKAIQERLRLSSITVASDTYSSVLPELAHSVAQIVAKTVPLRHAAA